MTTPPSKLTQLQEKARRQFKCGEVANALHLYRSVLKIKPDGAVALNGAGAGHGQMGNLEQAAGYFKRALEAAPQYEATF